MDVIRAEAPDTIVITTADNGAWQDAYPDAGTSPVPRRKGFVVRGRFGAFRASCGAPGHIPAGAKYDEMMSHIDCWATLASLVGVKAAAHGEWKDNNGKPIYFDSIDNSAYVLGKSPSTPPGIRGSTLMARISSAARLILAEILKTTIYTSRGSTSIRPRTPGLARSSTSGSIGSLYCLTMDPFEKYDMVFNGAMSSRMQRLHPATMPERTMAGSCR